MSNYPPLEHRPKGSRLPEGEWFNDIIDRVNAITEDPLPQAGPSPAINFTGTTVAGSTTVSGIADTTGLAAGQEITGVGIQATVLQGREAIYQISDTFDLPLIDNYSRWGSHDLAFQAGLIEHFARPLPAGDWDLARAAAFALSSV